MIASTFRVHLGVAAFATVVLVLVGAGRARQIGVLLPQPEQQQQTQRPARDTSARAAAPGTGTASIAGRVIDYESGRPLKRARVSLTGPDLPLPRGAVTDESGHYEITDLPAGRFTVTVARTGYVSLSWGQRRPGRTGRPFALRDRQQVTNVDFRLPRGSVITGRVLDEDGEPLLGATVRAHRFQYVQGQQRLTAAGAAQSDDRGQYRIFGLMPGNYFVSATARVEDGRGDSRGGRGVPPMPADAAVAPLDYAPTYYPGAMSLADAGMVAVGIVQEVGNIDFALQLVTTARISGTVIGVDGAATANALVTLQPDDGRGLPGFNSTARAQPDGSWTIGRVPPGRYVAVARGQSSRNAAVFYARHSIQVAGQDVMGVTLALVPGATITGTLVFEGTDNPPPSDPTQVRITATPVVPVAMDSPDNTRPRADGTFTLPNVGAGARTIRASGVPRPWTLRGAYLNGRDVADLPLEFKSGERVSAVSIVFTDRSTEITGFVRDQSGQPLTDYLVVAFSADQAFWVPQSRRIQTSRPDATGAYRVRGMPPGDYLLAAIDDAEQGQWYDPAFLDEIGKSAVRVTLADGETKAQDLKLSPM